MGIRFLDARTRRRWPGRVAAERALTGAILPPGRRQAALRDLGEAIVSLIVWRTTGGRDENGAPFLPYTPAYRRWKARHAPSSYAGGRVNLTLSGDMLTALVARVTPSSVRVGFRTLALAQRARYNEARGRRFLGISVRWLAPTWRAILRRRARSGGGQT
jgi:hypothetical protein